MIYHQVPSGMSTYIRPLSCLDYVSMKDIFIETFCNNGFNTKKICSLWKRRNIETSLGIFSEDHDILGFTITVGNHLARIAIHPDFQNQGLGSKLLVRVLNMYSNKNISVSIVPINDSLTSYYARYGFVDCGEYVMSKHYYNTRRASKNCPS